MNKKQELEIARNRRKSLLDDYELSGLQQYKFAEQLGLTPGRVSALLRKARLERESSK